MAIFIISFLGDRKKRTIYHLNFSVIIRKIAASVVKNYGFLADFFWGAQAGLL